MAFTAELVLTSGVRQISHLSGEEPTLVISPDCSYIVRPEQLTTAINVASSVSNIANRHNQIEIEAAEEFKSRL